MSWNINVAGTPAAITSFLGNSADARHIPDGIRAVINDAIKETGKTAPDALIQVETWGSCYLGNVDVQKLSVRTIDMLIPPVAPIAATEPSVGPGPGSGGAPAPVAETGTVVPPAGERTSTHVAPGTSGGAPETNGTIHAPPEQHTPSASVGEEPHPATTKTPAKPAARKH